MGQKYILDTNILIYSASNLIAATALSQDYHLATRNTKDFDWITEKILSF